MLILDLRLFIDYIDMWDYSGYLSISLISLADS